MPLVRGLSYAALAFIGFSFVARSEQIGPSFDCRVAQQPLAQMLCGDPDLSRTDIRFAQAYFALLKQVGDAGKAELKREDLQFLEAAQRQCSIPATGQAAPQSESSRKCVKTAYEAQRSVWVLRLTPPLSEEANRPIERHIALQRSLQQLGFLPVEAVIDGVYGAGTREAISQWQRSRNRNATGVLGDADAQALEGEIYSQGGGPVVARDRPEAAAPVNANPGGRPGSSERTTAASSARPLASPDTISKRPLDVSQFDVDGIRLLMTYPDVVQTLKERHASGKISASVVPCAQELVAAALASAAAPSGGKCISRVGLEDGATGDGEAYQVTVEFIEDFPEHRDTVIVWRVDYAYSPGSKLYDREKIMASVIGKYGQPNVCVMNSCDQWRTGSATLQMQIGQGLGAQMVLRLEDGSLLKVKRDAIRQAVEASRAPASPKF